MARAEYTTRRRLAMKIVVWVVCAVSLAVAAGVVHLKTARTRVDLGAPQTVGSIEIRLPEGWTMEARHQGTDHIIRCAEQRKGETLGRGLIVVQQSLKQSPESEVDPLKFLFDHVLQGEADEADPDLAESVDSGPNKGVVLEYLHQTVVGRTLRVEKRTAACVMLPGGQAVVIQYLGRGDPAATGLVKQIVESIRAVDDAGPSRRTSPLPVDGTV